MGETWNPAELSRAAGVVWGKASWDSDDWLPLWRHLADAGPVAGLLWDHWVPDRARRVISDCVPGGEDDARRLVVWLAGVHDIGKATPSFTCQVPRLADRGTAFGLRWERRTSYPACAHHTVTGQLILETWLIERHGWKRSQARQAGCVVGGHHGTPPTRGMLTEIAEHTMTKPAMGWRPGDTRRSAWRDVQWELLDWAAAGAEVTDRLDSWRDLCLTQQAQVLLTAIVIMADWIASNEEYFPYSSVDRSDRITAGWRQVSLPPRWRASDLPTDVSEFYRSRFENRPPRPLQVAAVNVARGLPDPSIMVIEAPMGEGKTEAALLAAEVIAERDGGGVVFALPTRATSDAMLGRILAWLRSVVRDDDAPLDLGLGHGKSRFNAQFQTLLRDGYACVDADWTRRPGNRSSLPAVAAHRWLAGRKKGLLSQFMVVTIDQILFAALKSRHVVLRHLGLAGKTVIIDEAHAYDVYMSQYLHQAVNWLAGYGCSVIVLSATLPAATRAELLTAYRGTAPDTAALIDVPYPAIISAGQTGDVRVVASEADATRRTRVSVGYLDEPEDDEYGPLITELADALRDGGCALVIRNTVARATGTAAALADHFGRTVRVRLMHSRFIAADRERNDDWLRTEFGADRDAVTTPTIVVATQVAEQSLDIDFDLLVTDLAPIDLILQRMGRVHRHMRGPEQSDRPEPLREARCLITGADWAAGPPTPVTASTRIYDVYTLWRSAAVLADHVDESGCVVALPGDIAPLVQRAYGDAPAGPAEWRPAVDSAFTDFTARRERDAVKAKRFRLKDLAEPGTSLLGWLDVGVGDVDDQAAGIGQVRDGMDSLEVLLLVERDGRWFLPDWLPALAGTEIPRESEPLPRLAKAALGCAVNLPFWLTSDEVIAELESRNDNPAWQGSHWLAGELVLPLAADTLAATVAGHHITYHPDTGLTVRRAA
ncbi:CRISPR-associated helicase Cas3' [Stackebrandtia albiflava]|uniref:CRISPR-associated helicase Cas3' n=1 Tax=Stackebrandtia albiflava TaxID=406432 RepID=UPI001B886502|nr:CRISPR-associated helicase Cas3' [Stackebrandtia albiflava]